ncbi:MAG: hypothetical protein ACHP8B_06450 [Terriglobales bacterium]
MANTVGSLENKGEEDAGGLICNRRRAIVAVVATAIPLVSELRLFPARVPHHSRWLIEPPPQGPQLRILFIGLSIWVCGFMFWILFWFYRAARDKYERFLVAGFAASFLFSTIERFVPPLAAADLHFASTGASLLSLAAALTLLFRLSSKGEIQQPK